MYRLSLYNSRNHSYKIISGWELHAAMGYFPEEAASIGDSTLQDIVDFTSLYENENQLKNDLLCAGFIEEEDLDKKFVIIRTTKNSGKVLSSLKGGISYKNDRYLYDVEAIKRYVLENMDHNNFMTSFSYSFCAPMLDVPYIQNNARFIYDYYINCIRDTKTQEELRNEINRFIQKYCNKKKGKEKDVFVDDFGKIRTLAMFIINYERNLARIEEEKAKKNEAKNALGNMDDISYLRLRYLYLKEELAKINAECEEYGKYNKEIRNLEAAFDKLDSKLKDSSRGR